MYIALAGMQHAGKHLQEIVKYVILNRKRQLLISVRNLAEKSFLKILINFNSVVVSVKIKSLWSRQTKSILICSLFFVPEFCSCSFSGVLLNGVRLLLRH